MALELEPLIFDVFEATGEIVAANYLPNANRYMAYDVSPADLGFREGGYDLLERIQALRSEIYWYSHLSEKTEALEDSETDEVSEFVDALSEEQRGELIRHLERWFEEEPDDEERDSNDIVRPTDGRQLAFRLFWDFDPEVLNALRITVVEGEHPGSSYLSHPG